MTYMAYEPCSICGMLTEYLCSDCMIDKGKEIRVCNNPKCRDEHEQKFCSKPDKA